MASQRPHSGVLLCAPVAVLCALLACGTTQHPTAPAVSSVVPALLGQLGPPTGASGSVEVREGQLSVNGRPGDYPVPFAYVSGVRCIGLRTLSEYTGIGYQVELQSGLVTLAFFGRRCVTRVGSTELRGASGEAAVLPCAPFWAGDTLYLPLRPVVEAFGMTVVERAAAVDVSMRPAVIESVRYAETDERFRVTVDLAEPTPFFAVAGPQVISVGLMTTAGFVPPGVVTKRRGARGEVIDDGPPPVISLDATGVLASNVTIENTDRSFVRISANGKYPVEEPAYFTLAGPYRIVLDLPKRWERTGTEELQRDLAFTWFRLGTAAGPVTAHAVLARLSNGAFRPKVGMADVCSRIRLPLSEIARRHGAVAAANGGYFAPDSGDPVGLLITDGEWVRAPYANRTALLISDSGRVTMGNVGYRAELTLGGQRLRVTGLNEWLPTSGESVKVITRRWGPTWPCAQGQACVQVRRGAVTQVVAPTQRVELVVPEDGYVVAGCGTKTVALLSALRPGTRSDLAVSLDPPMAGVREALGGGPRIVLRGQYHNTGQYEQFRSDVLDGRNPRTAVGITAAGDLLLVVVDGRQPTRSVGMTLRELSDLMIRLGATDAMALDSGGSSQLVALGRILNSPSDGRERPIPNALLIVPSTGGMVQ